MENNINFKKYKIITDYIEISEPDISKLYKIAINNLINNGQLNLI